jgi:hypothetical protein
MINKKISTIAGVLVILAVTGAISISFLISDKQKKEMQNSIVLNNLDLGNNTQQKIEIQQQDFEKNYSRPDHSKHEQPIMPTLSDEANKSPEQIVNDFYDWYIKSNNYWHYQIYGTDHEPVDKPINLNALTQDSIFVSSSYKQNIAKRAANGDPILCTQDTNYNAVKSYDNVQIYNNNAEVDITRGYQDISDTVKVRVLLIKENNQWKIDDIICTNLIE